MSQSKFRTKKISSCVNQESSLREKSSLSIVSSCNNYEIMAAAVALDGDSSTSTFTTGYSNYDVFVNFRGEDTRNNFIGFLNLIMKDKGIDVFIDSEKLWTGEAIGPALLRAIDGSKISIPVFSQGYANSKSCLLELAHIVQRHLSNGQLILPIFFDIDPSHVRNQTGYFEEAFQEHEKKFEPHIVESWRKALRVIGNFKGEVIEKNKDQAKIVESVVKRVLDELVSSTHLDECKYPIGIDSRVKDLLSLLSISSNNVQFIGICGFHGIGKTTIVEAVYNHIFSNFNRYSFISDVSKQAMQCMGLASLQKRFLKDIFKADFDIGHYQKGKKLIKRLLCKEKVLLVLDDVDSKEQIDALAGELNWFGQGSRIIIATRDEHILNMTKVNRDKIYWPEELDHEESLQLFSLHAFTMDEPPQDYMQLSHDIVQFLGGLPSSIEVLGTYLSGISSKEEWKSILRKLKTGKASISSLASLRRQRKNTCPVKNNPLGRRGLLHGTIGISNTVARVYKTFRGCLDLRGTTTTNRFAFKPLPSAKNAAPTSYCLQRYLNLNGSTAKQFKIVEIQAATNNFDESLVVGAGGFGYVYKGMLDDGTLAAIKRCTLSSQQGLAEFKIEIEFLSKFKHRHVVSLIGFCEENNEMILVYGYLANGELRRHLYGSDLPPLTWKKRLEICIGVARGLHYLHTGSSSGSESESQGIIHRDVKTSNILLDEKFIPKLADFGISKAGPALDETHVSTVVMGTFGYLDPEYYRRGHLTEKSDIYSFGVVLFEIVCARPVVDRELPEEQVFLVEWALQWQNKNSLGTIVDPRLEGNYCPDSLKKFGKIAEKCVADEVKNRPTMWKVLWDLEYVLQLHEDWLRDNARKEYFTCSSSSFSSSPFINGAVWSGDSSIGMQSALGGYDDITGVDLSTSIVTVGSRDSDDSTEEEYFTCTSSVGSVACNELSDLG